jgi:hypothetical protein
MNLKASGKTRFKARLIVLLAAVLVAQATTLVVSSLVGAAGSKGPPIPFAIFACIALALARDSNGRHCESV